MFFTIQKLYLRFFAGGLKTLRIFFPSHFITFSYEKSLLLSSICFSVFQSFLVDPFEYLSSPPHFWHLFDMPIPLKSVAFHSLIYYSPISIYKFHYWKLYHILENDKWNWNYIYSYECKILEQCAYKL
jgi:hypothetical protein